MAYLSKRLATIKKDVELNNFYLENFRFDKDTIVNDSVKDFFKEHEFHSLYKEEKTLKTWKDINLEVQVITQDAELENLFHTIKKYNEVFFDTETTSLDIMKAQIVGVSIYLDDSHIYYINHMHE